METPLLDELHLLIHREFPSEHRGEPPSVIIIHPKRWPDILREALSIPDQGGRKYFQNHPSDDGSGMVRSIFGIQVFVSFDIQEIKYKLA